MEPVTVYRAEPRWAQQALAVLLEAGLSAEILNDPALAVRRRFGFNSTVLVVVPDGEAARAREVLEQWIAESYKAAAPLISSVGWSLVTAFGPPFAGWVAVSVARMPRPSWLGTASVLWVLAAIAITAVLQRRGSSGGNRE